MEILQSPLRKCYHRFKARIIVSRKFDGTQMSLVSVIDYNYSIHSLCLSKHFAKLSLGQLGQIGKMIGITLLLCNVMSSSVH